METTALPRERTFTTAEYHQLAQLGVLKEEDRVELLEGKIYVMSPIGSRHAECVRGLTEMLFSQVVPGARVSVQNPIQLSDHSEPEPDIALLEPKDVYAGRHPRADEVLLVIEVADRTLDFDLGVKAPLYAEAGIRELWVIALREERIHVFRGPGPGAYAEQEVFERGSSLQIAAFPEARPFPADAILG